MQGRRKIAVLSEAVICSLGIMIFAFFIQYKFPARLISISALLVSAYIISRNIRTRQDLNMVFGGSRSFKIILIFTIIGIALGITGTIIYRDSQDISLLPRSMHLFVIPAALIGCMEE
ncbi:MAG: hypothetical protein IQL11_09490, partial [Bacteroidales bacterium]|nr:hypothetical protein [Bacteroidales bacterium]